MNGRTSRVGIEAATRSHGPPSHDASCALETRVYARSYARPRPRPRSPSHVLAFEVPHGNYEKEGNSSLHFLNCTADGVRCVHLLEQSRSSLYRARRVEWESAVLDKVSLTVHVFSTSSRQRLLSSVRRAPRLILRSAC